MPAVRTADRPLGPDQYRYIATRGWWMGSFGTSTGLLLHLTEQWIRQWVPARPDRDWMLDREVTGRVRWLTGTAEQADDEGFDPAAGVPTGRFRATHGDFYAGLDDLPAGPRTGTWHTPTTTFLSGLPRDPRALLARLRADGPEGRTASQPFARATGALRSGLVPADLRARPLRRVDRAAGGHPGRGGDGLRGQPAPRARARRRAHPHGADHRSVDGAFAGERDTLRTASGSGSPRAPCAVHLRDDLRGRHPRWPARLSTVLAGPNAREVPHLHRFGHMGTVVDGPEGGARPGRAGLA